MSSSDLSGRPTSTARKLLWVASILLVLAAAERFVHHLRSSGLPTGEARWIWADFEPDRNRTSQALAFYAVRDFEVEQVPERARLLIVVDDQYQLFLNGRRVGAGRYRGDGVADAYDVATFLVEGPNRLVIEARSRFLYGGILASLELGTDQKSRVVSDETWRIVTEHQQGLIAGFVEPARWQRPRSWDRPPTGRWPEPRAPAAEATVVLEPAPESIPVSKVEEVRVSFSSSASSPEQEAGPSASDDSRPQPGFLLDFGKVVEGHLELWAQGEQPRRTQSLPLVSFGEQPPSLEIDLSTTNADAPTALIFLNQRPFWRDVEQRRFRYALVSRTVPIVHAQVSGE